MIRLEDEMGATKEQMNGIDLLLEPLKKKKHEILRNPRARILRIHVSRDFELRLHAAGETMKNGTIDGSEYHLLGYPCEVHWEKFAYHWTLS